MPERATITQVVQIGVESTPGTQVAATKRLLATTIEPSIQADIATFRPMGGKFVTMAALGKEWVKAKISGRLVYTDIVYLLASALRYQAPTQITPPSGVAYRWVFEPQQSAEDPIKTYTVEFGSAVRAARFVYGLVTEVGFSIDREKAETSGSMLGRALQDGIALTANPSDVPLVPVLPTQVDVFLDNTAAALGTTKLARVASVEFSLSDRFGPVWTLDSAVSGFAAHVETELKCTLKLLVQADAQGMALLPAMRNGDKRFVRLRTTGPIIEGSTPYLFQVDMCGVVSDVGDFSDEDGVYAIEWTLQATYDSDWRKALSVTVQNTLSAL